MTTPKQSVLNYFHTEFQSTKVLNDGLVDQILLKAVAEFELNLSPIDYNIEKSAFDKELSSIEMMLLGKLMYKHYLSRERDRVLKLSNIVGKDISLTATGASKSEMRQAYEDIEYEVERMLSRLKNNSYN